MLNFGAGGIIQIEFPTLDSSIGKLKSMQKQWQAMDSKPPQTIGGGASVNELELMGATYDKLHTHMCNLISETILFMEKTRASYKESDEKSKDLIDKIKGVFGSLIGGGQPLRRVNPDGSINVPKPEFPLGDPGMTPRNITPESPLGDPGMTPNNIIHDSPLNDDPHFIIKPKPNFPLNNEPNFLINIGKGAIQAITETIPNWVAGVFGGAGGSSGGAGASGGW